MTCKICMDVMSWHLIQGIFSFRFFLSVYMYLLPFTGGVPWLQSSLKWILTPRYSLMSKLIEYWQILIEYWQILIEYWHILIEYWQILIEYWQILIEYWHILIEYWHILIEYCQILIEYWQILIEYWQILIEYWQILIEKPLYFYWMNNSFFYLYLLYDYKYSDRVFNISYEFLLSSLITLVNNWVRCRYK